MDAISFSIVLGCLFGVTGTVIVAVYAIKASNARQAAAVGAVLASNELLRKITKRQQTALLGYSADHREVMFQREQTERAAIAMEAARDAARKPPRTDEVWIGGEPDDNADEALRIPTGTGL